MPKVPHPEIQYFGKIDVQKVRKLAEAKRDRLAQEERDRLRKLHWRRCAECGMELESIPFKGKMVHKCFNCNGVFLGAGTLEDLCGSELHLIESFLDLFKF